MNNEDIGWVYVLKNPRFNDLKIGFTTYPHPQQRADEISKSTGVPAKFEVMYAALLLNPNRIDQNVHYKLRVHRVSQNREFFSCTILDAMSAIRAAAQNSIIQEIDNRPEIVKAREEAIRKQQEEQRRNEELIRQRELAKIEEQRRINENKRLEIEREKRRKIELEQQKKREEKENRRRNKLIKQINKEIDLKKSNGCVFYATIYIFSIFLTEYIFLFTFKILGIGMDSKVVKVITKWNFEIFALLAIPTSSFIIYIYNNSNYKKNKNKELEEKRAYLIQRVKDGFL